MDPPKCSSLSSEHHSASLSLLNQIHITTPSSSVLPESPSPNCPLLNLPPELRLRIYEELFQVHKAKLCLAMVNGSWHRIDSTKDYRAKSRTPDRCVALLATCKQIFAEAKPVLCANISLALYFCDTDPMDFHPQLVDLANVIACVHKIYIGIDLLALQDQTPEEIRTILASVVETTNNAIIARELWIDLTIRHVGKQNSFDWVMLCLGDIESNARMLLFLSMEDYSDRDVDNPSFSELLKKLLRVDEMSKVWQSQLDWEKKRHEYHSKRLPKVKNRMMRKYSEFEDSCSDEHTHESTASSDMYTIAWDFKQIQEAWELCHWIIQSSEENIADLEQKLISMASS